jgi:hypothetical protein
MHALLAPVIVAAGIVVVAGLIPLVEEVVKTVGVALTANWQPSLPQSLLWGLAAGAGFTIAEGLLNSTSALGAWLPTVLLRLGATLLHCLTGALMGLAWYQLVVRQRWARALGLYLASVAIHGLWNGLAAATALLSVTTSEIGMDTDGQLAVSLGMLITFLLLVLLALSMIGGLAGLAIHARRSTASEETPSSEELQPAATDPVAPSRPGTEA